MECIGYRLREFRERGKLSLREVEERSSRIAQEWGNPSYRITASWLYRVEAENRKLAGSKLVVLAVIYSLSSEEMLALYQPDGPPLLQWLPLAIPNATLLLTHGSLADHARFWLPDEFMDEQVSVKTALAAIQGRSFPDRYLRGIIGCEDYTMDPLITPGASVLIDTAQHSIAGARDWTNDFNHPIYFLDTRDDYQFGYCELDPDREWLTLVPYSLSHVEVKRWRYGRDAEVLGRVVGVNMRLATLSPR